jgi:hypothetical protein
VPSVTGFLGRSVSEAAGFGAGLAIAPALHPVVQEIVNRTWALHPDRPLSAGEAAGIVAEAVELTPWGVTEASYTGISEDRFTALLGEVLNAPGIGELLEARRRRLITPADFMHGLRKSKLETRWDAALAALEVVLLDPAVLAVAVQRGIIPDPGILPVAPPTGTGKVPAFPVFDVDALAEALGSGIDRERFSVMVGNVGLPMSVQEAASAFFRGIIERTDFYRAVSEGNTRNEWRDAILEQARQIPSVSDYVNLHLRGWISAAEMHAGAERHGMSPADTDRIYLRSGRPAAPGQMATAAARGIDGPDGTPMDRAQFLKGIAQSDIRPEWGPMLWDARFLYPPLFQLTRLVQAGAISADTAAEWAKKDRYPPEVVTALHAYWTQPTAAAADTHVAKAQTQLWGTAHRSYIAAESDDAAASAALATAGVAPAAVPQVLDLWRAERDLIRKQLTPAQIKKAYAKSATNEATGAAWTRDEALAALVERGYAPLAAADYLNIP